MRTKYKILELEKIKSPDETTWAGMNYYAWVEQYGKTYHHRKNTILIEKGLTQDEKRKVIAHEKYEHYKMRKGMEYEKAHKEALRIEKRVKPYGKIEKHRDKTYFVRREKGKFKQRVRVTKRKELHKTGYFWVYRTKKGRIYGKKKVRKYKKKPKYEVKEAPPKKKGNYRYDIVVRVGYNAKDTRHNRHGEISGKIVSSNPMLDEDIIDHVIESVKNKDKWIDYVEPNEETIIYIKESYTDEEESSSLTFRDTGI